jgi:hypothetical protein
MTGGREIGWALLIHLMQLLGAHGLHFARFA